MGDSLRNSRGRSAVAWLVLGLLIGLTACRSGPRHTFESHRRPTSRPRPAPRTDPSFSPGADHVLSKGLASSSARSGTIVVAGRPIPVDAPVVPFSDPEGYDAHSTRRRFGPVESEEAPGDGELRYQPGRRLRSGDTLIAPQSTDLAALREVVDQFVLHYDVCGTSARCFRVLHDVRGLSVHFMLDLDGTVYQCLDLRDQAWHASEANPRSIGIEIANMGARRPGDTSDLDRWSTEDELGLRFVVPDEWRGNLPAVDFVPRPARPGRIRGPVHGEDFEMLDLTPEQYDSLVDLTVALCQIFPRLAPDAPRGADGRVRTDALSPQELAGFSGVLGHHHVTRRKIDPGPAFHWDLFLDRVQAQLTPEL